MARKPRIVYLGALYHVILRGNDGQSQFCKGDPTMKGGIVDHLYLKRFKKQILGHRLFTDETLERTFSVFLKFKEEVPSHAE